MTMSARGLSADAVNRQRNEYQLTLNQGLGDNYGSLYITGSVRDYWNRGGSTKQYQVGYNNYYGRVTWAFPPCAPRICITEMNSLLPDTVDSIQRRFANPEPEQFTGLHRQRLRQQPCWHEWFNRRRQQHQL